MVGVRRLNIDEIPTPTIGAIQHWYVTDDWLSSLKLKQLFCSFINQIFCWNFARKLYIKELWGNSTRIVLTADASRETPLSNNSAYVRLGFSKLNIMVPLTTPRPLFEYTLRPWKFSVNASNTTSK